jgi:repressor of nif and glnA expression
MGISRNISYRREAVEEVLSKAGEPLSSRDIAEQVNKLLGSNMTARTVGQLLGTMRPAVRKVSNGSSNKWELKTRTAKRSKST